MALIKGDDQITTGFDRQLQHQFILRVAQETTPEEENPPPARNRAEIVQDTIDLRVGQSQRPRLSLEDVLILERQRDRDADLEPV